MNAVISQSTVLAILLGSTRTGAWLMLCPPFNTGGIPTVVKALLSVAITLPMTPRLAAAVPVNPSTGVLMAAVVEQVMIGAALGFLTAMLFAAVQAAGSLIDLFGGFSVAFAFDPFSHAGNAVFGRFYNVTATALLFGTDAHQLVLRGFTQSFKAVPLTGTLSLNGINHLLSAGLSQMFFAALQIAAPLIAVLFLTDIALGLMSKVAPSLNAFGLGFPAKILLTLTIAGSGLALLPASVASLSEKAVAAVLKLLGGS
jgi:flagellar biosynthetic protein FliR